MLETTGHKLNRLHANKNNEWHGMAYGYLYGPEVETRELVWFQGMRLSFTSEDKMICYWRTADGHEHSRGYTDHTTGFAYCIDQEAAAAEYKN